MQNEITVRRVARRLVSWLRTNKRSIEIEEGPPGLWIDRPDAVQVNENSLASEAAKAGASDLIGTGVTVVRGSVDPRLCDQAVAYYKEFAGKLASQATAETKPSLGGIAYPRIVNLHGESPIFRKLFASNRSLPIVDYCFGKPATVYTSLTFQVGTQQPIHRDIPVFRTAPNARYFGMWVALEGVDESNGPLMVIRGGHRAAVIDSYQFAEMLRPDLRELANLDLQRELWVPYQERVLELCLQEGLKIESVQVDKGDTVIWHSLLPHGGSPILDSTRTRYSCVFHIVPGHTPVYQADVFFRRDCKGPVTWGHKYHTFEGREFLESPPASFMA